jgi:hypothetical protein
MRGELNFSGAAYVPSIDKARLSVQISRILTYMLGGEWRTLREARVDLERLYAPTLFPEASISANFRNLRKEPYRLTVEKRRRVGVRPGAGVWEYRIENAQRAHERAPEAIRIDAGSSEPDDKGREEFLREARRIASLESK